MPPDRPAPKFVHFARALALVTGTAMLPACGATVVPDDSGDAESEVAPGIHVYDAGISTGVDVAYHPDATGVDTGPPRDATGIDAVPIYDATGVDAPDVAPDQQGPDAVGVVLPPEGGLEGGPLVAPAFDEAFA